MKIKTINKVTKCALCGSGSLRSIWALPGFPLTEMIGPYEKDFPTFDQELAICNTCGHVQLLNQLPPDVLYSEKEYQFRSGASQKASKDMSFFLEFLDNVVFHKKFKSIVDIGGNDLTLANILRTRSEKVAVVDPVCKNLDGQTIDGVYVLGRMIENVSLEKDLVTPDLVIFRHTLEHIADPVSFIKQCVAQSTTDCLFLCEIPCFDCLSNSYRFDAVFHQHYHYFGIDTLKILVETCGCAIIDAKYNHQGSCGGSLLIAFKKNIGQLNRLQSENIASKSEKTLQKIKIFTSQMDLLAKMLKELPKPVYGYGAGLMLSTLGYHLKTNFSELEFILDDDKAKDNIEYKNVPIKARYNGHYSEFEKSSYLVTSMESLRPILNKLIASKAKYILIPGIF